MHFIRISRVYKTQFMVPKVLQFYPRFQSEMAVITLHSLLALFLAVFQVCSVLSEDGYADHVGKTTGGSGTPVYVSNEKDLREALKGDNPKIVKITANIALSSSIVVGANKSIFGANSNAGISKYGLHIYKTKNVIVSGLKISYSGCSVRNPPTYICHQGVQIEGSTNVWVHHNEFFADLNHEHDYYTMGIGMSNGADYVTVSYNKFHDIYHTLLVGSACENGALDRGKFHVTFHHNWFTNVYERTPMIRFGMAHIYNNLLENVKAVGIAGYCEAQLLIEANVFINIPTSITTHHDSIAVDGGAVVTSDNSFTNAPTDKKVALKAGTFKKAPYWYAKDDVSKVASNVRSQAKAVPIP